RRIVGAEALIRWVHPTRGLVSPAEFIPLAEKTRLIGDIGAWTLREACRTLAAWDERKLPIGSVSVNLSPRQFQDPRLVSLVQTVVRETGIDPSRLEL
ncbi:EAL domain-containing protein, partial [Sabulibacter ruber]|uniref:EAL domain-containing protein n=1 Tax=Sabulibacter ruber TaxID=2811901 RepID=UPI001A97B8D9